MNRLQVTTASALVALASYFGTLSAAVAAPIAVASTPGIVRSPFNANVIGGPGATAARAQVGGDARGVGNIVVDPNNGDPFSDQVMIGGERALNNALTIEIGKAFEKAYPKAAGLPVEISRDLNYKRQVDLNKQAADNFGSTAGAVMRKGTVARAEAAQIVMANGVLGHTQAQIINNTERAFAAALANDPVIFELDDPSESATIEFVIGSDFLLRADSALQTALALFEIATDRDFEGEILSLAISISGATAALNDVVIDVLDFNAALFTSEQDLEDSIRSQLSFDLATHTLTAMSEIVLYEALISAGEGPVKATFNYGAVTAGAVPEPATLTLFTLGGSVLVLTRALHRRRKG